MDEDETWGKLVIKLPLKHPSKANKAAGQIELEVSEWVGVQAWVICSVKYGVGRCHTVETCCCSHTCVFVKPIGMQGFRLCSCDRPGCCSMKGGSDPLRPQGKAESAWPHLRLRIPKRLFRG